MSCLCIGGVCIPYTALLPVLLIGLQWIAAQFAKVGLLPEFVAKRLGLNSAGQKQKLEDKTDKCDDKACCTKKTTDRSESAATTATSDTSASYEGEGPPPFLPPRPPPFAPRNAEEAGVEHIDNLERWEEVFTSRKNSTLIVKFTAEWCKPCKKIQPAYVMLAGKYESKCKFITLDIDGDDCDVLSSKMSVAMMPTFICLKEGAEIGRLSGGNDFLKLGNWVTEMCS